MIKKNVKKYTKDKDCLLQLQKEPKKCLFLKPKIVDEFSCLFIKEKPIKYQMPTHEHEIEK